MAIKRILRMGDNGLRQIAVPVESFDTPELHELVTDLLETMAAKDGAGLAATQIGVPLRVVVFGIEQNPRYPKAEPVPLTVLVNPIISVLSETKSADWEGCLSVPGMRGLVSRYTHIGYTGVDHFGKAIKQEAENFHARVVQHECDHLDGILYPERMENMTKFGFIEELQESGQIDYPIPA